MGASVSESTPGNPFHLHLGDCLPFLRSMPDKSVDHVITDPPYEAEAHSGALSKFVGEAMADRLVLPGQALSFAKMDESTRAAVSAEMGRIVRRWAIVFCQVEAAMLWRKAAEDGGLIYRRTGIWWKPDAMPQFSGDRPSMGYESILIAHAKGKSRWNGGGRQGVWTFNKIGPEDRNRTGHETQKPVALMEALVRDFTDPGETILDPFAGSGTTGVAALKLGRRFIGCELSPKYHAVALKRLSNAREQLGLWTGAA